MFKKIVLMSVIILAQGCGIKGPPLPPLTTETIQKQKGEEAPSTAPAKAQEDPQKNKKK
jgi:hypothetical protein